MSPANWLPRRRSRTCVLLASAAVLQWATHRRSVRQSSLVFSTLSADFQFCGVQESKSLDRIV